MPSAGGASAEVDRRQLFSLEHIITALLKCKSPSSPIVKEKIEQAEKLINALPFDPAGSLWHVKLASWWVEFALQQVVPAKEMEKEKEREEEEEVIVPQTAAVAEDLYAPRPSTTTTANGHCSAASATAKAAASKCSSVSFDLPPLKQQPASATVKAAPPLSIQDCLMAPEMLKERWTAKQKAVSQKASVATAGRPANGPSAPSTVPPPIWSATPSQEPKKSAAAAPPPPTANGHAGQQTTPAPAAPHSDSSFEEVFEHIPTPPIPTNFEWGQAYHSQTKPPLTFSPSPNAATSAPVPEPEPTPQEAEPERVPDDFDWASTPANAVHPNPFARRPPHPQQQQHHQQQGCYNNYQANRGRQQRQSFNWQ